MTYLEQQEWKMVEHFLPEKLHFRDVNYSGRTPR